MRHSKRLQKRSAHPPGSPADRIVRIERRAKSDPRKAKSPNLAARALPVFPKHQQRDASLCPDALLSPYRGQDFGDRVRVRFLFCQLSPSAFGGPSDETSDGALLNSKLLAEPIGHIVFEKLDAHDLL